MIEALVLDFDGLILDTETPFRTSWHEIYEECGLAISPDTWASLLGSSADPAEAYELLEEHLGRPVDRKALRIRRFEHELELLKSEHVMPGVCELIEEAKTRGLLLVIASSSKREWVVGHLSRLELQPCFDAVVCAEDVTRTKPEPDLYLTTLRTLDVRSNQAIAFEDSVHGVEAAKKAGIFCVAVPNQVTRHLPFAEADLIVDSLSDRSLDEFIEAARAHHRSA